MREVEIGSKKYTTVYAVDEPPGPGEACHEYYIDRTENDRAKPGGGEFAHIQFQKGPIKEAGVNGCHQEDLIVICIDRLRAYQAGMFACGSNALALTKLEEALHWLKDRTEDRLKRGVEGTYVI